MHEIFTHSFDSNKMATITSSAAEKIASLSKPDGRKKLQTCLRWSDFDEEQDMQKSIHLDFLFDTLMFVTEKGFKWDQVATVCNFADRLVQKMKDCYRLTDILGFYNSQSSYLFESLGDRNFKILSSYIFETVLPHFKLYQLVFNFPRKEQIPNVPVLVEPPFESKKLKETKTLKVWDYEQQLEELDKKEKARLEEIQAKKEQVVTKIHKDTSLKLEKSVKTTESFDKEKLGNIIEDVMRGFTLAATESLKHDIERLRDDLEFKLEKTSLPRPQVLGPPPRYNLQPPVRSAPKTPKSAKPGSRGSLRTKKK
ncbi:uncharacterized protein C8orf74 homolog isoform X1 [Dreissena polymorpha]|uniref:Uncharacterized protein n=1 Tax=Dreissena polymorpha TaxID=45954 RepID=A0A9D4HE29_DREPO|nr:uncharacterized protein C8orf74 homolog isoform X1 [Dreissena polymorpha]KAH3831731.1 hypothetical protein DPMN_105000 [Dreissena polymorpha]